MKKLSIPLIISITLFLLIIIGCIVWFSYNQNTENDRIIISPNVIFRETNESTDRIERIHDFLTNKEKIKYEIPEWQERILKNYIYSPIEIKETIITWCIDNEFLNYDWIDEYIDNNIDCSELPCNKQDCSGYRITIPWWNYNAYLLKNQEITHCSITNPIVCRSENIDKNAILEYYNKHKKCPVWLGKSMAGVLWPTAYCYVTRWYCRIGWEVLPNGKERPFCWFKTSNRNLWVALWDPCDFFKWMWVLPGDWSCW